MEQRTVFDDFRDTGGLQIPYYTETQWYTRDRVMQIEKLELNVEVDDALFGMPPPPGMEPILSMVGSWEVKVESRQQPGGEFTESATTSTIETRVGGNALEERTQSTEGGEIVRTLSYDRYRETYRFTEMDERNGLLDLHSGNFDDAGKLTVDNKESGTTLEMFGMTIHTRTSVAELTEDGFVLEQEASTNGGEEWWVALRMTYSRGAKQRADR